MVAYARLPLFIYLQTAIEDALMFNLSSDMESPGLLA